MSLETLRLLRLARLRPESILTLVAGPVPNHIAERPDVIAVTTAPERMDWRPVIGLPVAVFVADGFVEIGERAFECAMQAGGLPVGVAFSDGAHCLTEEAKAPLWRLWELLCR